MKEEAAKDAEHVTRLSQTYDTKRASNSPFAALCANSETKKSLPYHSFARSENLAAKTDGRAGSPSLFSRAEGTRRAAPTLTGRPSPLPVPLPFPPAPAATAGDLRDDARALVALFHEWNGVDERGIPRDLRGADYVQTFNADKWEADVEISVELSAPSRLYVLFDRRLEPPEWLTNRFIDTGDVIGVDESFRTPGMAQGGIGPGVSIETVHRIWVTEVPEAGVVKLGALPMQDLRVRMYGIAAIPLNPPLVLRSGLQRPSAGLPTHLLAFEDRP